MGVFAHPIASGKDRKPGWRHGLCGSEADPDDIACLTAILLELRRTLVTDKDRVFLIGVDSGAVMAQRAAAAFGSRIAGVAAFGGAVGCQPKGATQPKTLPAPTGTMDVVLVHGGKNELFPYGGGKPAIAGGAANFTWLSSDKSFAYWSKANRCQGTPKRELRSKGTVRESISCSNGTAKLIRYSVEELGSGWPAHVGKEVPFKILLDELVKQRARK